MSDRADADPCTPTPVTFEVEMTRVETVTLDLPEGVGIHDLSSKRLRNWPDAVMEAIEEAVAEKLLDFHGWQLAQNITEITHDGGEGTC